MSNIRETGRRNQLGKRIGFILLGILLLLIVCTGEARAFQTIARDTVYIAPAKVLSGPYLLVGQTVRVDGTVDGDVCIFAPEARINGVIKGDLIIAASTIEINGPVEGDIRAVGGKVDLRSDTYGSFTGVADNLSIERDASIGRDLVFSASRFNLHGQVARHISAIGESIYLDGKVGGNIRLAEAGEVKLGENARISGNLKYSSPKKATIAGGAVVEGSQRWHKVVREKDQPYTRYLRVIAGFLGFLLVWWVFRLVSSNLWERLGVQIISRPWRTLLIGTLLFIMVPWLVIVLIFTAVGAPLGLILGAVYAVVLYLSKIIVASALGELAGRLSGWKVSLHPFWLFLLGLSLTFLLTRLPQVGWLISLMVIWWGMGATCTLFFTRRAA